MILLFDYDNSIRTRQLRTLNTAFDPLGSAGPAAAGDVLNMAGANLNLIHGLSKRLLGAYTKVRGESTADEMTQSERLTSAQTTAHVVGIAKPLQSRGNFSLSFFFHYTKKLCRFWRKSRRRRVSYQIYPVKQRLIKYRQWPAARWTNLSSHAAPIALDRCILFKLTLNKDPTGFTTKERPSAAYLIILRHVASVSA